MERTNVLEQLNEATMNQTMIQLFEEQVAKTPEKIAIVFEDKTLTYSELNRRANALAYQLRTLGVGREDYVVMIAKRSIEMIVGLIGILKSGGVYVPIEEAYPTERIHYMLEDVNPLVILTYEATIETNLPVVDLNTLEVDKGADENPVLINEPEDLIYCIYTSGTTGKPKGVMVEHKGVVNLRQSYVHDMGLTESDVLLQFASICFAQSAGEILSCLTIGAVLCIAPSHIRTSPTDIEAYINKHAVTFTSLTPKLIQELNPAALPSLRFLESGGEAGNLAQLKKWTSYCQVVNAYGMTEMTLNASFFPVDSETETLSIGRPIVGTQLYIMNDDGLCETGVVGELCIAGNGVARGYLNQPELTKKKFVQGEERLLYRTGDLAKWLPDGNIAYVGRIDEQVKIRGFRVELSEIQRVISALEDVKDCAVIANANQKGEQTIYAYLVSDREVNLSKLRNQLANTLLPHMIPTFMTQIKSIPLTTNGKIDKRALLQAEIKTETAYVAPRNEKEQLLSDLFKEVLGVNKVGIHDNFFALGGNSLNVMRVAAKIKAFNDELAKSCTHEEQMTGFPVSAQDLFDYPTIEALMQFVEKEHDETVGYQIDDFKNINKLLAKNKPKGKVAQQQSLGDVLITGVTGWLGAHVLDEFLTNEQGIAYCVVRGTNLADSKSRLDALLTNYFAHKYTGCERIVTICGDISKTITVSEQIDTIINCAANVKHYGSYEDFYGINVIGTQNMITLAKQKEARLFHISTTFVFGNPPYPSAPHALPNETSLFISQSLENVYVRSKFESEMAVFEARLDGLEAAVIRVGNLTNRFTDLKFQKNYQDNASLKDLKAFADLGIFPEEWGDLMTFEFSPVDLTANAIIKLAGHYHNDFSVFHVYNQQEVQFRHIASALNLTSVSLETFINEVKQTANQSERAHIYEALVDFEVINNQQPSQDDALLDNDFSMWYLKQIGFDWSKIDARYVKAYVAYFEQIGYWTVPV